MWIYIVIALVIFVMLLCDGNNTRVNTDKEYLDDCFPGMLEAFEEASKVFLTIPRENFVYKYRTVGIIRVVGMPEESCYRLQIECGQYPDESWRNFFPAGWDSMIFNGENIIYKKIYIKHGNVYKSGHDWFLERIVKVHNEWKICGDCISVPMIDSVSNNNTAQKPTKNNITQKNINNISKTTGTTSKQSYTGSKVSSVDEAVKAFENAYATICKNKSICGFTVIGMVKKDKNNYRIHILLCGEKFNDEVIASVRPEGYKVTKYRHDTYLLFNEFSYSKNLMAETFSILKNKHPNWKFSDYAVWVN